MLTQRPVPGKMHGWTGWLKYACIMSINIIEILALELGIGKRVALGLGLSKTANRPLKLYFAKITTGNIFILHKPLAVACWKTVISRALSRIRCLPIKALESWNLKPRSPHGPSAVAERSSPRYYYFIILRKTFQMSLSCSPSTQKKNLSSD